MEKSLIFIILLLSILSVIALYELGWLNLTGLFVGFGPPAGEFKWWSVSWKYRFRIEINSTLYSRVDWPIEYQVNFTDLLPYGTFDENSTRVIEYGSSGSILYEVPSQFDKSESFNATNNAIGTLVFLMNGTTPANSKRVYYVYYDILENGQKEFPNYSMNIKYEWIGDIINVTNSLLKIYIDTNRGENTSGIYRVEDKYQNVIVTSGSSERTVEYLEYSNSTHNMTFDLRNNGTFIAGPVRLTVKQTGDEVIFGNPNQKTNEARVIKKYYIYDRAGPQSYGTFIKVVQAINNTATYNIERNSTPAGVPAFDLNRTLSSGSIYTLDFNTSDPYSWAWGSGYGGEMVGLVNLKEEGTSNFYAMNSTSYGRIGIHLETETISSNSVIEQISLVYFAGFGGSDAVSEFLDTKNRFSSPVNITQLLPEQWYVEIVPSTNATVYNRNESVLIFGNVSAGDPYNLTKYMNATLDMGTPSTSDDQTVILYDDGTHGDAVTNDKVFTNIFSLADDAAIGIWTINFTAYSNNSEFLNSTIYTFNVTDILNVSVNITNKKPIVGSIVTANIYVKNYRQDSWIAGAMINCSFDSSEVLNKTDYNNGTYSVNFTAPEQEGSYVLICNATKNGNFGNGSDSFSAEPAKTYVSVAVQPSNPHLFNVTLYQNESFAIAANASNFGNGTAYSTNITLELLEGWSANKTKEECGDLEKSEFCVYGFNITVPNGTSPGNYYINTTATWKNPDETISTNKTQVNVTVESNPRVDVEETEVSGLAGDGIWNLIGNFTVASVGNDALQNISLSCVSGEVCQNFTVEFIPKNISTLPANSNQSVMVNVTVALGYPPGTYNGTINVSAQNDGFDTFVLEVIVPAKTNVSMTTDIASYTAYNITQQDNETFSFLANATNIGNGSARFVNISLALPSGWSSNSSLEDCGNLTKNSVCSKGFNVTIPQATQPGNYLVNLSANWTNPDNSLGTNKTSITVTVASNPKINVSEANVSGSVADGTENTVGNFTVLSIGNDILQNVNFDCVSGEVCQNFTVEFIPSSISSLAANSSQSVMINVSVPLAYPPGTYNGTINVSAQNDGFDTFVLEVYVPENRTWDLYPEYCEKSTQQPEGIVCEVNVTNKGNVQINFTVYPVEGNYTKVNETNFSINRSGWHVFKITYNVTGVEPGTYNSTFTIDAIQPNANPDYKNVRVSLLPYIPPIINISIIPNETEQNNSVKILANIADRSGSGIAWAKVNITRPDGAVDTLDMFLLNSSGNLTMWELTYPNGTNGSTIKRGFYNVTVYGKDNVGNENNLNSSFLIYTKLNILFSTLSDKYYQGDTGSIYYVVQNLTNHPLANMTVNFTIRDSQNNITYLSSNLQTNSDGSISPLPTFSISSDAVLGNYTLTSYTKYFDEIAGKIVEKEKNHTFQVLSRAVTVTGLFADIETAVVWYPENIMKFGILVYNGEGRPVDPTSMNLTVYDPANNLYFSASMQQMTKLSTGYYLYQYAMPAITPSGMFLAVLNVSQNEFQTMKLKAFRVAHGGPYDVRITLLENEVEQGSYLDFVLTIENKGEVSQDVFIEYWVSSKNITYFSTSEAVYTPSLTNQSFTRSAYIYSNQPLGNYYLNVRVTYDSVQPPILTNASFIVVAKVTPTIPTPPVYTYPVTLAAPLPAPTEKILAGILITRYNSNISLARGFMRIESVVVNNTGQTVLNNVSLYLLGIAASWFNITPESYKTLEKEQSVVFLITFNIPKNARVGEYGANLIASSGVVSDQKPVSITIFESVEELLRQEIKKLKEELEDLRVEARVAEREGKDTSSVWALINEIKSQISLAEENLEAGKSKEAMENITNARNLIEKARDLLSKLEVVKVGVAIPFWMILLIVLLIVIASVFIVLREKKKVSALRPWVLIPLGKIVDSIKRKKPSKEEMAKEREKLFRMLEVLEKERKEGLISAGAYREMKKNIEKKLAKIEEEMF